MNAIEFGYKLHELRNKKGFSLRQLQHQSGVNNAYISLIEHGKRIPKTSTLRKLAHGLRVPTSKLFEMAGIEPEHDNKSSGINLDRAFANHEELTYHNKRVSPETIKYIKRMLGGDSDEH